MFNQLTSALPDGFFGSGNKRRHQQTTAGEEENQPHHYLHAGEAKLQMPPTKTMHVSNGKSATGRVALRNITNNTTTAPLPAAAPLSQSSRPKAKITKNTSTDRRKKRSSLSSRRRTKKSVTSTPNVVTDEEEEEEENPLVALRGSDSQSSMDVILPSPISAATSTKPFSHSEALLVSAAESSARTRASHDQMELEQRAMDSDYEVDRDTACEATSSSNAASPNEAKQKEEVVVARKHAVDEEEVQTIGGGWEVLDIDFVDEQDPQWCTTYVNDIYVNLRINEQLRRPRRLDYMTSVQKGITSSMRGILCDWLVEVADEYELSSETLFLAVNYLDRFLAERRIDKRKFQLVGVTAMFIAAKYEEIYAPAVEEFVYISANTYSREEILMMEAHILNTLEFQLTAATTKVFLRRFLKAAGADLTVAFLASYLAELTLLEYSFVKYLPSQIAAAAVFLALRTLNREPWTPTLTFYTQYSINDAELQQCIQELYNMYCTMNENASLQAVREKYSHKRFHRVSAIPPPEVSTGQ